LHFRAYAGEAEEHAIEGSSHGGVDIDNGAGDAAAFELVEQLTGPAEEKEDEYYIT